MSNGHSSQGYTYRRIIRTGTPALITRNNLAPDISTEFRCLLLLCNEQEQCESLLRTIKATLLEPLGLVWSGREGSVG